MKSIETLIKLQKRDLDDKRRQLKAMEEEIALLEAKKEELKISIIEEQKKSQANIAMAITLPAFIKTTRRNIETIEDRIAHTQQQAEKMRDQIALVFQELKRYEIYDEIKTAEAGAKEAKREQREMDELGLRGFVYKDRAP